jgi:hypothetical protein
MNELFARERRAKMGEGFCHFLPRLETRALLREVTSCICVGHVASLCRTEPVEKYMGGGRTGVRTGRIPDRLKRGDGTKGQRDKDEGERDKGTKGQRDRGRLFCCFYIECGPGGELICSDFEEF